jgi:hypothetical protein
MMRELPTAKRVGAAHEHRRRRRAHTIARVTHIGGHMKQRWHLGAILGALALVGIATLLDSHGIALGGAAITARDTTVVTPGSPTASRRRKAGVATGASSLSSSATTEASRARRPVSAWMTP